MSGSDAGGRNSLQSEFNDWFNKSGSGNDCGLASSLAATKKTSTEFGQRGNEFEILTMDCVGCHARIKLANCNTYAEFMGDGNLVIVAVCDYCKTEHAVPLMLPVPKITKAEKGEAQRAALDFDQDVFESVKLPEPSEPTKKHEPSDPDGYLEE